MTMHDCWQLGGRMTAAVAVLISAFGSNAEAQVRRTGFSFAADAVVDVTHMTDFTPAGFKGEQKFGSRRGEGGGAANRVGFGGEIEYEKQTRRAWLFGINATKGWLHYRQDPDLGPYSHYNFKYFTTAAVTVGARQYLRRPNVPVRAFADLNVGYERLTADLYYHNESTDTLVYTAGPLVRVRLGSQWRVKEKLAFETAFQWQLSSFGEWTRSGRSIPGAPTKMASYTLRSALRLRM